MLFLHFKSQSQSLDVFGFPSIGIPIRASMGNIVTVWKGTSNAPKVAEVIWMSRVWPTTSVFICAFGAHLRYEYLGVLFKGWYMDSTLRILGMSWGVKTTFFEAWGVSLGWSGVSIGGVRILRVVFIFFWGGGIIFWSSMNIPPWSGIDIWEDWTSSGNVPRYSGSWIRKTHARSSIFSMYHIYSTYKHVYIHIYIYMHIYI